MAHIFLLTNDGAIPQTLREAVSAPGIRAVSRSRVEDAATALERGAFDLAIIYAQGSASGLPKNLRALRALAPKLPTVVIAPEYSLEGEESAFKGGADLYFSEPLPRQSLERIIGQYAGGMKHDPAERAPAPPEVPTGGDPGSRSALRILRDFSNVFSFSLDYKAFTQHFILKLRDYVSFSKIGIFLEPDATHTFARKRQGNKLECIASLGLPPDLVECFQLSRDVGIGRALTEDPRVLHHNRQSEAPFPHTDATAAKEFGILGCHLAIPVSDRERTIGVVTLSGPVTGRRYTEDELQLLYLLMEELGQAIRNSRLHSELAAHGELIDNVLTSMSSGALVLGESLEILYSNAAARKFLKIDRADVASVDWAEFPPELAGPVHRAVEKGDLPEPFVIPGPMGDDIYRVSIIPFSNGSKGRSVPQPVMVMLEDFTSIEASKQSALRDTKSEIISLMAERFAHEIRNSLVPLTTHMQLIDKKIEQKKFQTSLKKALYTETSRIKRFSEQMLYIAQNSQPVQSEIDLERAIIEGFDRARIQAGNTVAKLDLKNTVDSAVVKGNVEGIVYAFEELFLNSMQAQTEAQKIHVELRRNSEGILSIRIRDEGPGFAPSVLEDALEPFFTTRNTGVGLGLSVAKKIFEEHQGYLTLNARSDRADWDVGVELPANVAVHSA